MKQRFPEPLAEFLRGSTETIEDANGEEWFVELEDESALPATLGDKYKDAQVFAHNGVGDLLFLLPEPSAAESELSGEAPALGDRVFLFRHEGAEIEELPTDLGEILRPVQASSSDHPTVRYYGSDRPVRLGDRVELKLWLVAKREGEVTYVPGISDKKSSMERDGLAWVEVRLENGDRVSTIVDPETHRLKKSVKWLS